MVFLESKALGTPVFATRTSSAEELLRDNIDSFICENSEKGICERFTEVVENKHLVETARMQLTNYHASNAEAIAKIMEACEMDFIVHSTTPDDIYYGYYDNYITIPSEDFYAHINSEDSFYGNSNNHSGYLLGPNGKKYEFTCSKDTDKGLVVRNIPMLPVEVVLDYFEIPYKAVTLSPEKGSVAISFYNE